MSAMHICFGWANIVSTSFAEALAFKFGYPSIEAFKKDGEKRFSLLENGILDLPSTRLLLINVIVSHLLHIEEANQDQKGYDGRNLPN